MKRKFLIEKRRNKKLESFESFKLILSLFLLILLATSLISAYARSNIAYTSTYIPGTRGTEFPLYDRSLCGAGQDFILQISPTGCIPSVVRSDLLEEQNVPVFCPITATQLNPLIDVEAIKTIDFSFVGPKPPEVQGRPIYVPARAALGVYGAELDNAILDNIGYAVIILKRQKNESAMSDFVLGNLTARIRYDIENAFGVGRASFYLPELNDDEWEENFIRYGFWDGRGYLRAESIDENSATISIYSDRETHGFGSTGEKRKLSISTLNVGEESAEIFMPGFNYCLGTMKLKLNGVENPATRVQLNVNGDVIEVMDEEKFLDNKCQIKDIEKFGLIEKVKIKCKGDGGADTFSLAINPKVILSIDGGELKEYSIGDILYPNVLEGGKEKRNIFLGYVGKKKEVEYIIPVISTASSKEEFLKSFDKKALEIYVEKVDKIETGVKLFDILTDILGKKIGKGMKIIDAFLRGTDYGIPIEKGEEKEAVFLSEEIKGNFLNTFKFLTGKKDWYAPVYAKKKIEFVNLAGPQNKELSEKSEYYDKAIEDYDEVIETFSSDKYPEYDVKTLGEKALLNKIKLVEGANQKKTVAELCEEFEEMYPYSILPPICSETSKLSSSESAIKDVEINGRIKRISFEGIEEPSEEEYSVDIRVEGAEEKFNGDENLRKDEKLYLSKSEFIVLKELKKDYAVFDVNGVDHGTLKELTYDPVNLRINLNDFKFVGKNKYRITINKINLKKVAKVSVNPKVKYSETKANFPFQIGIEKRGIQLAPEKIKEKIGKLNKTISKWKNINDKLGKVVEGFKYGCLGVGTGLVIKNFFSNLEGKGIARSMVMRGDEGWFEICKAAISNKDQINGKGPWKDIDACLLDNSEIIDSTVNAYAEVMKAQDEEFEKLQELYKIKDGFLGEDIIDTAGLKEDFIDSGFTDELGSNLKGVDSIKVGDKEVSVSEILEGIDSESISLTQAKSLQLNSELLSSDNEYVRKIALAQIKSDLGDIWVNNENEIKKQNAQDALSKADPLLSGIGVNAYKREGSIEGIYDGWKTPSKGIGQIPGGVSATSVLYGGAVYILQLEKVGDQNYRVVEIYDTNKEKLDSELEIYKEIQTSFSFKKYDRTTYQNHYNNAKIRYYEAAPYKGLPAIVPFDIENGWYAAIKSTLSIGSSIKAYDDSGRISSFWLCNVGENGEEEFNSGMGDDICEMINLGTGQPYNQFPGLEKSEASQLVNNAVKAIKQASKGYGSGVSRVKILNKVVDVGKPAVNIPDIQCQDFMSPSDCNLLFNVCDPVVCPSSRCDLGGTYPVADVVQSGIIGSLVLCLPNFPDVKIPVCLSGVHAGLEGLITVLDSYQQCLQTSLDTGETVGICDEIYSIYLCEFFWRESLPLVKITIPKIIGAVLGQNVRGGGEYLGVQDAWQKASDSVGYFAQYYAANSFKAFKTRTAEGVGTAVCKNFVSLATPQGGNLLDALVTPDSPPQFYGRFDEIPFTTATNPPISHYKVFYHVYAGTDYPAYYQVYLQGTGSSYFQDASYRRIVAQGFIKSGDYKTETLDFTAPSGYQEMCIVVNGQEECGFKQVTTDFGANYITDKYLQQQASQTEITTENECISGTTSIYSLLNPNLQAGAEEMINPAIYNKGLTRICATDNPGETTDSAAGTKDARWVDVGYCGSEKIRCWLDTDSVKDVIKSTDIEEQTLEKATADYLEVLKEELGYIEDFGSLVKEIEAEESEEGKIEKINENYEKVFYPSQKGYLILLRADAYASLVRKEKPEEEASCSSTNLDLCNEEDCAEAGGYWYDDFCNEELQEESAEGLEEQEEEAEAEESEITKCEDCGNGWNNLCDEEECLAIGEEIGKECVFKKGFFGWANTCTEKTEEEIETGEGEEETEEAICSTNEECMKYLGEKIVEMAEAKKGGVSDSDVRADTGAESFECLVLQVAYTESKIRHCKQYRNSEGNPLYCDGNKDEVLAGDESSGSSLGIMQINTKAHPGVDAADFEENVNYGIDYLILGYNRDSKTFTCTDKSYSGWARALRNYNGWGCTGNTNYVEDVISKKDEIENLFPEICS